MLRRPAVRAGLFTRCPQSPACAAWPPGRWPAITQVGAQSDGLVSGVWAAGSKFEGKHCNAVRLPARHFLQSCTHAAVALPSPVAITPSRNRWDAPLFTLATWLTASATLMWMLARPILRTRCARFSCTSTFLAGLPSTRSTLSSRSSSTRSSKKWMPVASMSAGEGRWRRQARVRYWRSSGAARVWCSSAGQAASPCQSAQ